MRRRAWAVGVVLACACGAGKAGDVPGPLDVVFVRDVVVDGQGDPGLPDDLPDLPDPGSVDTTPDGIPDAAPDAALDSGPDAAPDLGPSDEGPADPGIQDPGADDPGASDPGPVDPGADDPVPPDPGPPDPGPVDPGPVDPGVDDPGAADPGPVDPGAVDPGPPDPGPADPGPADPGLLDAGPTVETACGDGADDDHDGLADCLDPDCAGKSPCPADSCSSKVDANVQCGTTLAGRYNNLRKVSGSGCGDDFNLYSSVFRFVAPATGSLRVDVTHDDSTGDKFNVYVLPGVCNPSACAAKACCYDPGLSVGMVAGGTYFIVVTDNNASETGHYTLKITCP